MKLTIEIDDAKIEFEDDRCTAHSGEHYFERCKEYVVLAADQLIRLLAAKKEKSNEPAR